MLSLDLSVFTPLKDKVWIKIVEPEDIGGIHIPQAIRGKTRSYDVGEILAIGPEAKEFVPELEVGQTVVTVRYGHQVWDIKGEKTKISIVRAKSIELILDKD